MVQGSLAHKLRVLRAKRGLTLREAASLTGVAKETISDLERGLRHPHDPTLAKIAKGYDVSVEELLEEPALAGKAEASETGPPSLDEHYALQLLQDLRQHATFLTYRYSQEILIMESTPTSSNTVEDWDMMERESALLCIGALSILRDDEAAVREVPPSSETRELRRSARRAAESAVAGFNAVCDEIEARASAAREAADVREPVAAFSVLRRHVS